MLLQCLGMLGATPYNQSPIVSPDYIYIGALAIQLYAIMTNEKHNIIQIQL